MKKEYNLRKMKVLKKGPVIDAKQAKVMISLRLDGDILNWLVKASDERRVPYQTLINSYLKEAMDRHGKDGQGELRKLIQEEVHKISKTG